MRALDRVPRSRVPWLWMALAAAPFLLSCKRGPVEAPPDGVTSGNAPAEDLDGRLTYAARAKLPEAKRLDLFTGMALTEDESESFGVVLSGGRCYWFLGVAESSVGELALFLYDPAGKRVSDAKKSDLPVMQVCPIETARYQLRTKVPSGKGAYHVGLYANPGSSPAP
jgi:hypothetical protein